ncbi:MAG: hypothetical protein B7Z47_07345, partial [Chthoniobacter sp. 12-60-6]
MSSSSSDKQLWALNAADGTVLWNSPFSTQYYRYYSPAVSELGVYVGGGFYGGIYGFNYQTGAQKFFLSQDMTEQWTPAIIDGKIYSFVGNTFRNHHPDTGVVEWSVNLNGATVSTMSRTICGDAGRAFVVNTLTSGAELVGLDLQAQSVLWRTAGTFKGTPATANGVVYACSGGVVKSFNSSTGAWVADFKAGTESSLNGSPLVSNDLLIIGSSTKTYIFNLTTSALIQTLTFGSQAAAVNDLLAKWECPQTRIHGLVYRPDSSISPADSQKWGLGKTTARETADLLQRLEQGSLVNPDASREMLNHLLACDDQRRLGQLLPEGTKIAMKTGSVTAARTVAGILYSPQGPIIVCVLTSENKDRRWSDDNASYRLSAE